MLSNNSAGNHFFLKMLNFDYRVGDEVAVVICSSSPRGLPPKRFHGGHGTVMRAHRRGAAVLMSTGKKYCFGKAHLRLVRRAVGPV